MLGDFITLLTIYGLYCAVVGGFLVAAMAVCIELTERRRDREDWETARLEDLWNLPTPYDRWR